MTMSRHFVLSDTGCYEVGNELPVDSALRVAQTREDSVSIFREQCDYCREHVTGQLAIIAANPSLTQTSDYYWAVVRLELPLDIEVDGGTDNALWTYFSALGLNVEEIRKLCVETAGDETAVQQIIEELCS